MTCIAAIRTDDGVWMAADRRVIRGWGRDEHATAKLFRVGPLLMGCAGGLRERQVVQFGLAADVVPDEPDDRDAMEWVVADFVPAVRQALTDAGRMKAENGVESIELTMLVAFEGRLFRVGSTFGVIEAPLPFAACGSGEDQAFGALYATDGLRMDPPDRLRLALEAAERGNIGVGGPFDFEFQPATVDIGPPAV